MKTIAVIGTGTAGITTLAHLLAWLQPDWKVISIHDPSVPMLGIGESTTTTIPDSLYNGAGFNFLTDLEELDSTIKHGVKYTNWRENDVFTIIPPPSYAIHFNNFKLKEFCFSRFIKMWGDKFQVIEGNITDIENNPSSADCKVSGVSYSFDYIFDCRGYPTDYSEYDIIDTIPVNHCLVNMIPTPGDWNYTYHQAHENGWMFGIPLRTRQGWGYLYNDNITTREDAVSDIAKIFNTTSEDLNLREFSFKNFRAKKFIDGRIIKNGNRALFYEPIEALSGWFYDRIVRAFVDSKVINVLSEYEVNATLTSAAEDYELFICYMYHKGSMFKSKFWDITTSKCSARLENSEKFKKYTTFLKTVTPEFYANDSIIMPFDYKIWHQIDKDFGFKYFTPEK
jgi:hypothetical protein